MSPSFCVAAHYKSKKLSHEPHEEVDDFFPFEMENHLLLDVHVIASKRGRERETKYIFNAKIDWWKSVCTYVVL